MATTLSGKNKRVLMPGLTYAENGVVTDGDGRGQMMTADGAVAVPPKPDKDTTYAGNGVDTSVPSASPSVTVGNGTGFVDSDASGNGDGGNESGGEAVVTGGSAGGGDDPSNWDTNLTYVYDAVSGKWVPKPEEKVDTYEQFLAGAEERAKGVREDTYAANAAARASAEKNAEKERQRAIVDADASYQLNTSAYGANAERLASMGLTNSGYADYLKSQSYAQMRGEVQYANAQSDYAKRVAAEQEAAGNREADLKYADYVNAAEGKLAEYKQGKADKLTAAADTLLAAASAVTSAEELEALIERANNAGLSQEVINNIKSVGDSAVIKYGEQMQHDTYLDILVKIDQGVSASAIEAIMKNAGIAEDSEYYTDIMNKLAERRLVEFEAVQKGAASGDYSAAEVEAWARENGYVDENGNITSDIQTIIDSIPEVSDTEVEADAAAQKEAYNSIINAIAQGVPESSINILIKDSGINTDSDYYRDIMSQLETRTERYRTEFRNVISDAIKDPEFNSESIISIGGTCGLTKEETIAEYQKIVQSTVTKDMFRGLSDDDAYKKYHDINDDPYVDETTKKAVRNYYDDRYIIDGVTIPERKINVADEWSKQSGYGENFSIVLPGEGLFGLGKGYDVEHGKRASEYTSKALTATYKDQKGSDASYGAVVVYEGRIFMYCEDEDGNDGWTLVQKRESSGEASFKALCGKLGVEYYSARGEEF